MIFCALVLVIITTFFGCSRGGGSTDISGLPKTTGVKLRVDFATDVATAGISGVGPNPSVGLDELLHNQVITIFIAEEYIEATLSYRDKDGRNYSRNITIRSHHRVLNFDPGGNISIE